LVGRNTVEEAILARADAKLKLTVQVLGSADTALGIGEKNAANGSVEEVCHMKFGGVGFCCTVVLSGDVYRWTFVCT
uniref:Phosphopyruvate hydratase n=1 Tax=Echinostoma caproni TaxID=27848 RepID=A0A183A3U5_9TREM